jgi:hypothetical protein
MTICFGPTAYDLHVLDYNLRQSRHLDSATDTLRGGIFEFKRKKLSGS